MKKVALVAALMGPERTRTDMLAYLQSKKSGCWMVCLDVMGDHVFQRK